MATVNLLPWRERRRYQQQRRFKRLLLMVVIVALISLWLWNRHLSQRLHHQQQRNAFLQQHLSELDQRYQRQQRLHQERTVLMHQQQQLAGIYRNPQALVRLLETLAQTIPDGVYLTSLNQTAERIEMAGRVDQPASLTPFLRQMNASDGLAEATLVTLETDSDHPSSMANHFQLDVRSVDLTEEEAG
ncbi:hypothetical protein BGP77_17120 [Saccharospirillum sp. MSK14-1]|uniref:PilN domain-containing protein n=1 Tax=Saccharospirillum sp. MSK14-1 TaxID=1897632 RepID=UPI000D3BA9A4|nr:PilN domain-containing protein [Saccharospirillum sp. MSK14-1]PTY38167.1 hypothetical protein BGP77_17120 [Saccharospirillum sp. MSK14-1]